jgi:hypothetical protein
MIIKLPPPLDKTALPTLFGCVIPSYVKQISINHACKIGLKITRPLGALHHPKMGIKITFITLSRNQFRRLAGLFTEGKQGCI